MFHLKNKLKNLKQQRKNHKHLQNKKVINKTYFVKFVNFFKT